MNGTQMAQITRIFTDIFSNAQYSAIKKREIPCYLCRLS